MEYDVAPMISNRKGSVPTSFLSENQAASYLNMSVSWLRKCRDLGTGPVWMKFGVSVRYPTDALLGYVQQSTRSFTGEKPSTLNGQAQRNG